MSSRRTASNRSSSQVVLGIFLALAVIMMLEGITVIAHGDGVTVSLFDDRQNITLRDADRTVEIEIHGEVELDEETGTIARMDRGARLRIEEEGDDGKYRLSAKPGDDGEIEIEWKVGREIRPFDEDGKRWLAAMLPRIYRSSGLDADRRTARLLARGGIAAVLEEIGLIPGDYVQRRYFAELLAQSEPEAAQLSDILRLAGKEITSDHELAALLLELPGEVLEPPVDGAFQAAAETIASDHELGRVLDRHLEPGLSEARADTLVSVAGDIQSDHTLSRWLRHLAESVEAIPAGLPALASTLESDHAQQKALQSLLAGRHDDPRFTELLEVGLGVGSDYELRQLLVAVVVDLPSDVELPAAYFRLADTVGSDHELSNTLQHVLERRELGQATLSRLIATAGGLESDHALAEVLLELVEHPGFDPAGQPGLDTLLVGLQSKHHREQVEEALAARRDGV